MRKLSATERGALGALCWGAFLAGKAVNADRITDAFIVLFLASGLFGVSKDFGRIVGAANLPIDTLTKEKSTENSGNFAVTFVMALFFVFFFIGFFTN
jgi:hypothetical protein